jgi:hypothetical protein
LRIVLLIFVVVSHATANGRRSLHEKALFGAFIVKPLFVI